MRFGIVRILKFILCSLFHTTSFVLDYPTNKSGYVPEKKEVEIDNTNDQFHCFRNNNQKKKVNSTHHVFVLDAPSIFIKYNIFHLFITSTRATYSIAYLAYFSIYCKFLFFWYDICNKEITTRRERNKEKMTRANKETNRKNIWGNLILYFFEFFLYINVCVCTCTYIMSLLVFYLNWPK